MARFESLAVSGRGHLHGKLKARAAGAAERYFK
jgi:hypothetical protein